MTQVTEPFPIFYDDDGTPLENGMIYVGEANQDPRVNPIVVYTDEARTVPIAQPIRTLNGRPAYQGAPVNLYVAEPSYSITIQNRFGTPILTESNATFSAEDVSFDEQTDAYPTGTVANILQQAPRAFNSIAALRLNGASGARNQAFTLGYHSPNDGGGGFFVCDLSDTTSADNHGTIIVDAAGRRWKRQLDSGALNRRMFGARLDLIADDTTACQRMFNAANNPAGNLIELEPGQAIISSTLTIANPVKIIGPGAQINSVGTPYAEWVMISATANLFNITHSRSNTFKDFSIRAGVTRTAGTDFVITGAVSEQPLHNVWDNITTNGSFSIISMPRGCKHWKVTNCTFLNYGHNGGGVAIFFPSTEYPDSADASIHGNSFVSTTREVSPAGMCFAAIYLEKSFGLMITGNKFFGGTNGIYADLKSATGNLQISANSFEQIEAANIDVRQGDALGGGGNITISGNELSRLEAVAGGGVEPTEPGIVIRAGTSAQYLANIAITGNVFNSQYDADRSEIAVFDGAAVTIVGNTFRFYNKNTFGAIQTGGFATEVVIADNAFAQMNTNMHYKNGLNSATKVIGDTLQFAELGSWANGSMIYVPNGTPGNPLTGGGSGSLAIRRNGVWVGL